MTGSNQSETAVGASRDPLSAALQKYHLARAAAIDAGNCHRLDVINATRRAAERAMASTPAQSEFGVLDKLAVLEAIATQISLDDDSGTHTDDLDVVLALVSSIRRDMLVITRPK